MYHHAHAAALVPRQATPARRSTLSPLRTGHVAAVHPASTQGGAHSLAFLIKPPSTPAIRLLSPARPRPSIEGLYPTHEPICPRKQPAVPTTCPRLTRWAKHGSLRRPASRSPCAECGGLYVRRANRMEGRANKECEEEGKAEMEHVRRKGKG